jgi:hypothetical protein
MAAGCRIVASNTPPVREVLTDQKSGLLVDFFDVPALVASASSVLGDPGAYDAMAMAARREAARYDLETICKPRQLRWLASVLQSARVSGTPEIAADQPAQPAHTPQEACLSERRYARRCHPGLDRGSTPRPYKRRRGLRVKPAMTRVWVWMSPPGPDRS